MTDNKDSLQVTTPTVKEVLAQWAKELKEREGIPDKPSLFHGMDWSDLERRMVGLRPTFVEETGGVNNCYPTNVECYSLRNTKVLLSRQRGVPKHKRVHRVLFILVKPSGQRTKEKFKIKGVSWRKAKKLLRSKVRSYENTLIVDVTFNLARPIKFLNLDTNLVELNATFDYGAYKPTPREVDCPMCAAGIPLAPHRGTLTGRISSVDPFSHVTQTPKV